MDTSYSHIVFGKTVHDLATNFIMQHGRRLTTIPSDPIGTTRFGYEFVIMSHGPSRQTPRTDSAVQISTMTGMDRS
jgi:hypothetical protein